MSIHFSIFVLFHPANAVSSYPLTPPQALTDNQIRDRLSAIDTKNFPLLSEVFTPDITANFSLPLPMELLHGFTET